MRYISAVCLLILFSGCFSPRLSLISDGTEPLQEFTIQGAARDKVLLVSITGLITDQPERGLLRSRQGLVTEVLAQLNKGVKDPDIKAVVIKVDSPGGTVTASDILYHEIKRFHDARRIPVLVSIMGVGASGAYYLSLPADRIIAHPTSIVGSVGVIYMRPKVYGLMDKLGIGMEVNTSGPAKDMGSPFKATSSEEDSYFQAMIDQMATRFFSLVEENRKPSAEALETIKTAAVFMPEEALKLGLVDGIGYLPDTIRMAEKMAGIEGRARVVTYRRYGYSDDTLYNNASADLGGGQPLTRALPVPMDIPAGFYYVCPVFLEN